jgi:Zn-dependent membrane protease YugP
MIFIGSYWWILIPGLILSLWAQWKVRATFEKYSRVAASSGMTGAEVARGLLRESGEGEAAAALASVHVEPAKGTLTDHYDPRARVLRLSQPVYSGTSLAALGVAAHETGHALQHATGYGPLGVRAALLPTANIASSLALPLFLIGWIFGSTAGILMDLGILLYMAAVAFTLLTLPVEFNASRRAVALLRDKGYIRPDEAGPAKAVLDAAALTYLAAAAMALLTLVRLILLRGQRD